MAQASAGPAAAYASAPVAVSGKPAPSQPAMAPSSWSELGIVQQRILAPLASEWPGMPEPARRKWLHIARAYPKYPPAQQQQLQARMADWVKLTPEQRHRARENYRITQSLPKQKKSTAWQRYQQLPEAQRRALAAAARAQQRPSAVTALPGNTGLARDAARALHHGQPVKPNPPRPASAPHTPLGRAADPR